MANEKHISSLRYQYPIVLELSFLVTLLLLTFTFTFSKDWSVKYIDYHVTGTIISIENIPITHQIKRPPPPPRPTIPIGVDEPALASDETIPDTDWLSSDIQLPPPPDIHAIVVFVSVEKMPSLIGGEAAIMNYIVKHDLFPVMAKKSGVGGRCTIQFTVNEAGVPVNLFVASESPEGLGFGKAGLQVMAAMLYKPGIQHDRAVKVEMRQDINFNIR